MIPPESVPAVSTIKPGTRCECRTETPFDGRPASEMHGHSGLVTGPVCQCSHDAVRMVTVPLAVGETFRYQIGADRPKATVETVGVDSLGKPYAEVGFYHMGRAEHGISTRDAIKRVPMCDACATYHESKAGAR